MPLSVLLWTAFDPRNRCCRRAAVQSASNLVYPSVDVDLSAIDSALAQHIPSLEVQQRLQGTFATLAGVEGWLLASLYTTPPTQQLSVL